MSYSTKPSRMKLLPFAIVLVLGIVFVFDVASGSCGQKKMIAQQFISHGYRALAGSWPWHGAMFVRAQRTSSYACGVTVLTEQFVITVAHCTIDPTERQRLPPNRVFIKLGVTNLEAPERHAQQHSVDRIIRHDGYDENNFEDDIALMRLYTEITYSSYVQPICLWSGDKSLDKIVSKVGYMAGWGLDENDGMPQNLTEATMPIVSRRDCLESDRDHYSIVLHSGKTFCAGYGNGTSAGTGDSGGGLFLQMGNQWVLRGLVSNGKTDPNTLKIISTSYLVLTDVSNYLDWIQSHVTITTMIDGEPAKKPDSEPINMPDAKPTKAPTPNTSSGDQTNLLGISLCGIENGGDMSPSVESYPWVAVIEFEDLRTRLWEVNCHGVLIHPSFVLTAAFCIEERRTATLRSVLFMEPQLKPANDFFSFPGRNRGTTDTRISIAGVSTHPDYNKPKFANDIALLKLDRSTTITPICLPVKATPGGQFIIVGWKVFTNSQKHWSQNTVQLSNFAVCKRKYAQAFISLDTTGAQICSDYNHYDDTENCSRYVGAAPIQFRSNDVERYFLASISTLGSPNCRWQEYPELSTNAYHYSEWIRDQVQQNE